MQNIDMDYDSRSVTNFILDLCDEQGFEVTNMSLNKIVFFAHSDLIATQERALVKTTFEAWQHGPVLPVIYHQFKRYGPEAIRSRAKKLCKFTGDNIVAEYNDLIHLQQFLEDCVSVYGRMSASQLRALSHEKGGAWDYVWNSSEKHNLGMKIPNKLIFQKATQSLTITEQNCSVN
jgi:uncharacterized phage-associated protein